MAQGNEHISVLVVDDDERFRRNAVRLLGAKGFAAHGVESGNACLEVLECRDFNVVVLDQKMPGMSGLETLRAIREQGGSTEVVFLTGHASVDDAVDGMYLGAADYLLKPVDTEQLADKIRAVWERKQEKCKEQNIYEEKS